MQEQPRPRSRRGRTPDAELATRRSEVLDAALAELVAIVIGLLVKTLLKPGMPPSSAFAKYSAQRACKSAVARCCHPKRKKGLSVSRSRSEQMVICWRCKAHLPFYPANCHSS